MSRVIITLEDNPEGTVNQTVAYEMEGKGGFDVNSQAHQYSRVMLKFGNDIAREGMDKPANSEGSGIVLLN